MQNNSWCKSRRRLRVAASSNIIINAHRPASIDKDFLGNCTAIRTGRLAYPEDVKAVTKVMGVPPGKVEALRPLEWLRKDMATGRMTAGVLTF